MKNWNVEEGKVKEFKLPIGTIQFSDDECEVRDIRIQMTRYIDNSVDKISDTFSELLSIQDREKSLNEINKFAEKCIDDCLKSEVIQTLVNYGIYRYDIQEIRRQSTVDYYWKAAYQNLVEKYEEIKEKNRQEHEYRAARKANRGKWQGGGFGMKGAIKGAAKAGVLNGVSGMGHSFRNAVGNMSSDYSANKKINAMFSDSSVAGELMNELHQDFVRLYVILIDLLKENGVIKTCFEGEQIREAASIYNNLDMIADESETMRALCQCFKLDPFEEDFYRYYFDMYIDIEIIDVREYIEKGMDEDLVSRIYAKQWKKRADRIKNNNADFFEMCDYFGVSWKDIFVDDMFYDLQLIEGNEDDIWYELNKIVSYYIKKRICGFKNENIDEEKEIICPYDMTFNQESSYLVNFENEEEAQQIVNDIYQKIRINHEIEANEYQKLVYITRGMVVKGRKLKDEFTCAEDAIEWFKNMSKLKDWVKNIDYSDEESIKKITTLLEKINNSRDNKVGSEIIEYLKHGKMVYGAVFDFFVTHVDLEKDIKEFSRGTFHESLTLKQDSNGELVLITDYFNKAYYTNNEEEREKINKKIKEIHQKYNQLDLKKAEEINLIKAEVQSIYEKTKLGGTIIEELDKRLDYLDKYERTVLGVLYDTKEEAERERKKVVGADKYETEEEAKCAKKELNKINLQIKQSKDYKELKQYILSYRALEGQNIQSVSGNKRKQEIASDIIQQYIQLNDSIRDAEKQKNMVPKWHVAEIIVGIVGVFVYFNGGFFSKLLGIGMVIFAIYHAVKITNQMKESMLDSLINEKNIIDKMMFIRNNTIFFRETSNEKVCPTCGATVREGMNFCTKCGAKIQVPIHTDSNMNKCPTCGADIKPGMKFCTQCGAILKDAIGKNKSLNVCPACGAKVEPSMKFCTQCGQTLKNTNEEEKNVL